MNYKIDIRPLAAIDIIEGYDWYQSQKEGLGGQFLQEIEVFLSNLIDNPFTHSFYEKPVRQGTLRSFPYTVVYEVFEDIIVI